MDTHSIGANTRGPALRWDVFCRVVDNLGDIGVCWRLCTDLASRGQQVRLWIDCPDDLDWMAPGARQGLHPWVQVLHWTEPMATGLADALSPADVWVEAFGCDPARECIDALAGRLAAGETPPVWLNLEYMSAEPWVERCHRLPSPVMSGPLKGLTKWFFYPGFTPATGGLLREATLPARQLAHEPARWLRNLGLPVDDGRRRVSLFCYEPESLGNVMRSAGLDASPADWLITPGRASAAVDQALGEEPPGEGCRPIRLPRLTQQDYDRLLWSCDLNFVRGEDSLVRALWAGKPFVWQIYPQHDNAHHAKLDAFLDWLQAPPSWRAFHHGWNGMSPGETVWPGWDAIGEWASCALQARDRLLAQADLCSQLLGFVMEKR